MNDDVTDDGRRWYACGAHNAPWGAVHLYPATNARAALAAYRRDLVAAEHANGFTIREIRAMHRAAGLYVTPEPLTTPQAYEYDLARALADEITRWTTDIISVPLGAPITPGDFAELVRRVDMKTVGTRAEKIRAQVRATYTRREGDR